MEFFSNSEILPIIFTFLMGLAIFVYVILDGYDLGVGIAMKYATPQERDIMMASIGPFWDANETWLVFGVGILLVAFPMAHGAILTALYLPAIIMSIGIALRGVSFDFRAKAQANHKNRWDNCFIIGSTLTSLAQGYMLGSYITGFQNDIRYLLFNLLVAVCLAAGYLFVGSSWLIMKTSDKLQKKAVSWAHFSIWFTVAGMSMVSIATPLLSERIFNKWFSLPNFLLLIPIPMFTGVIIICIIIILNKLSVREDRFSWIPFASGAVLFFLGFIGLAYSFYPYIVPEKMTIFEAASAPESLLIILIGALIVLPLIIGYTVFSYKVFSGKADKLEYY
ncbi:MAG: cytochrome d ubiquinol oxidase subunit II [Candidatus Midichloria sp.]|nr:cytochrome d ubiquinol oxidase subunit II [Candidatus Midichloria sp.]